jgi:hypothetical protein
LITQPPNISSLAHSIGLSAIVLDPGALGTTFTAHPKPSFLKMAGDRNGRDPDDFSSRIGTLFMRRTVQWQSAVWGRFQELEVAIMAGFVYSHVVCPGDVVDSHLRFQNTHARLYNREVSGGHGLIEPFMPLFSVRDGQEIPGFPVTHDGIMTLTSMSRPSLPAR